MTDDLVEFLRARLDERESEAEYIHDRTCDLIILNRHCNCGEPEQIKAEVEAKRQVVELCGEENGGAEVGTGISPEQWLAQTVLRQFATVHSDHPGYREERRP